MSRIAKALKKNESKNGKGFLRAYSGREINYNFFIGLVTLIFIILVVFYLYFNNKKLSYKKKFEYPTIVFLEKKLNDNINSLNKQIRKNSEGELELLLAQGKYEELFDKAKASNNVKYQAIYFFKINDFDRAEKMFRKLFAEGTVDDEIVSYLSAIYLKKNLFDYALNILNSVKSESSALEYNKAVVYEISGDYINAIKFYEKSLNGLIDPLLIYKVKVKLFILKNMVKST